MNFLEKLDYLMKKNNLNKSTLSKGCDIPYTTIDGWYKKGYEGLKLTTLRKLSKFFKTSLDFWVNDDEEDLTLSPAQKSLIADLEKLTEEELIAVKAFIKSLKEMKENKDRIVEIPVAAYGGGVETKKISSEQLEKLLDDNNDFNKYEIELEQRRKELLEKMLEEDEE